MKIKIRNYQTSDGDDTMLLMRALAKEVGASFNPEKWRESDYLRLFSPGLRRQTLVAEDEDTRRVVGMGMVEARLEPTGQLVGYLTNWIVDKSYRDKGVGRMLAETAIDILTRIGVDLVRVNVGMNVLDKLSEKLKKIGFNPVYVVFEKELKK
ncbi:MAG: GNAT family N-acetyltransferase [Candidatus Freyarchaeota archaeon]|nr:GNAT family N-acetyltransferase [Candidatus Freyrarchaeum guaymaensis]